MKKNKLKYSRYNFTETTTSLERFELLCTDGSRKPLNEYRQCNWGLVPSHALVTSSARTAEERKRYQQFITKIVQLYSSQPVVNASSIDHRYEGFNRFDTNNEDQYYNRNQQQNENLNTNQFQGFRSGNLDSSFTTERYPFGPQNENATDPQLYEKFDLFESKRYGGRLNLMFQDAARNLIPIKEDDQSFAGYLGQSLGQILEIRHCPVGRMTLCVTSDAEMEKCIKMRV